MTSVRAVPLPKSWSAPGGTCRWCGKKIKDGNGKTLRRRRWHQDCVGTYLFARAPQPEAVADKSNDRCAGCGTNLWHFSHAGPVMDPADYAAHNGNFTLMAKLYDHISYRPSCIGPRDVIERMVGPFTVVRFEKLWLRDFTQPPDERGHRPSGYVRAAGPYSPVEPCWVPFHVDHIRPLWSVDRTLPWQKLIKFWLLTNLQALCLPCHALKTAQEAKMRAAQRRTGGQASLAL